ncbi:MAG TPA: hypothetical protein PKE25_13375, partial [Novosphingobium sp.]|nr:hypothetical protein [Novosphingobium sp.]
SLRVRGSSDFVGKQLGALAGKLPSDLEFSSHAGGAIQPDARLAVSGTHDSLEEVARRFDCTLAPVWLVERLQGRSKSEGQDLVVVELAVTADSRIVGLTVPT